MTQNFVRLGKWRQCLQQVAHEVYLAVGQVEVLTFPSNETHISKEVKLLERRLLMHSVRK